MDDDYVIISDSSLYNFIYKFSSNGSIDKCLQNTVPGDNDTYVSYFDMNEYVNDLKKSYNSKDSEIVNQFQKDYDRQNIKLNGIRHNNYQNFMDQLKKYLSDFDYNLKLFDISYESLVVLLCCQSSFYLPYQLLVNLYEIDNNSDTKALVCDSRDKLGTTIHIFVTDDKMTVELNTNLYIREIATFKNTHKIQVSITVELDKKIKDTIDPQICVFSWHITPVY